MDLGTQEPADCREFFDTYGTGLFAGCYRLLNPFAKSPYSNLAPPSKEMGNEPQGEPL